MAFIGLGTMVLLWLSGPVCAALSHALLPTRATNIADEEDCTTTADRIVFSLFVPPAGWLSVLERAFLYVKVPFNCIDVTV